MKLSKNIRYIARIRDYETAHVEVGAEADHHDLGFTDDGWAELAPQHRATFTDHLEIMVINEVEKLAREELEMLAQFSEISPNLAEDFLSTPPRSQNARGTQKKVDHPSPSTRRVRRNSGGATPPAA